MRDVVQYIVDRAAQIAESGEGGGFMVHGSFDELRDKLFWRPLAATGSGSVWCCFQKSDDKKTGYVSLCARATRTRSGGQKLHRPPVGLRCGLCDGREADRRGAEESLPESPDWKDRLR